MSPAYIPGKSCCLGNPHFSYNLVTWNKGTRKVEIKPVATAEREKKTGKTDHSYAKKEREKFFLLCRRWCDAPRHLLSNNATSNKTWLRLMEMHVTGVLRLQSSIITKMDVGNKRCVLESLANTICPVPCCHYRSFSKPLSRSHRVVMTVKPTVALILIVTHAGACHPLCYTTASVMICTSSAPQKLPLLRLSCCASLPRRRHRAMQCKTR